MRNALTKKISLFNKAAVAQPKTVTEAELFADLYQAYTYPIFNYCLFRVSDRQVAEDLTADVFERAWRARGRYRSDLATFGTWLFTIARRVVADWQRHRARHALIKLSEQQPGSAPSLETRLEESEEQRRLRQLIQTLPPHEQELIALKFGAGMNNREIAKIIDKSETAVGSSLHRLMKKLRAQW